MVATSEMDGSCGIYCFTLRRQRERCLWADMRDDGAEQHLWAEDAAATSLLMMTEFQGHGSLSANHVVVSLANQDSLPCLFVFFS